jgi:hypothetical protein
MSSKWTNYIHEQLKELESYQTSVCHSLVYLLGRSVWKGGVMEADLQATGLWVANKAHREVSND